MADRYWVGATNSWSGTAGTKWATTSGGAGGAANPTAADDVFFDAASGAVTVTISAATARSINCTGFTGTLSHSAAVTVSIGDATAGASNVALLLVSGMTYTLGSATTSALSFVSTSATQQTITTGGKILGNYTLNGAGSSYLLADANTSSGTLTHTQGTFNTGAQTCSWVAYAGNSAIARTLTITNSAISVSGTTSAWATNGASNLTLNATGSTITITDGLGQFGAQNLTYNNVVFAGVSTASGSIVGTNTSWTCANLTVTGTAIKNATFWTAAATVTITNTLTINSNSSVNRLLVQSSVVGTARTFNAATVVITNTVEFMDITGAGAATWTVAGTGATALGDAGGNSGITFTTPVTQTHTASAGGNWSDVTKWTSRVPLPQDNVVVDVNTTGTLTSDMPRLGKDLTFTGFTGTWTNSVLHTSYGSLTLGSGMTLSGANFLFLRGRGSHTITSAGRTITAQLVLDAGGTYTLQDALVTTSPLNLGSSLSVTFNANNFNVTSTTVTINIAATVVNMGSGTWSLTNTVASNVWAYSAGTINAGTSAIAITTASTATRTFAGGSKVYNVLTYTVAGSTGTLVISGANTFATLNFSDVTNARTLTLPISVTTTIGVGGWNVNGTAGKLMTVNSSAGGSQATLSMASGVVASDYLSIQDSNATGGATWYAGANSTSVSNNTGWIFTIPTYPISASDTGTGTDTFSALLISRTVTETGTGVDAFVSLVGAISGSETGTGTDTGVQIGQSGSETGTGVDVGTLVGSLSGIETGLGTDAVLSLTGAISDTETGTGIDAGILAGQISGNETGIGTDVGSLLGSISASDIGTAVDTFLSLLGSITDSDAGTGIDLAGAISVVLSASDSGVGVDAGSLIASILDSDSGTGDDDGTLTAFLSAIESAFGTDEVDALSIELSAVDSATGVDLGSLLAEILGSDSGEGTDTVGQIGISDSDSGTGTEGTPILWFFASDSGVGVEGQPVIGQSASDDGAGVDVAVSIGLFGSDSGTGTDAGPVLIGVFASDSGHGVDTAGPVIVYIILSMSIIQRILIARVRQRISVGPAVLEINVTP